MYNQTNDTATTHINFANIVKHLVSERRGNWQNEIARLFDNMNAGKEQETEILNDFFKAMEYLTIRLRPFSGCEEEPHKSTLKTAVYKIDLPETYSMLALDLPTRFLFLTADQVGNWKQDSNFLFQIAYNNISCKLVQIKADKHI